MARKYMSSKFQTTRKNITEMKKRYDTPYTETIDIEAMSMLALSVPGMNDNEDGEGVGEFDANEHRSDWDNIWAEM